MIKRLEQLEMGVRERRGSTGFYKEFAFEKLLELVLPFMEKTTGYALYKTYSYARIYHNGEELKKHTDRPACEITVSLCLANEENGWPIFIEDAKGGKHSFTLKAGEALVFKGIELPHWREPNIYGECSFAFLHYVRQNGRFADQRDDLLVVQNPRKAY